MKNYRFYIYLILISIYICSCAPSPRPIQFGHDQCADCKMIISDPRYGAELVTKKGKIYFYDSIECLAAAFQRADVEHQDIHSLWVINFMEPEQLIDARQAFYLHSENLPSPMGLFLTAFKEKEDRDRMHREFDGILMDWEAVLKLVKEKWLDR